MSNQDLLKLLLSSSDPVIAAERSGKIVWKNDQAAQLLRICRKFPDRADADFLSHYFSSPALSDFNSIRQFACFSVDIDTLSSGTISQSVFVVDISGPLLEGDSFLLFFESAALETIRPDLSQERFSEIAHDLKNPLGAVFSYADTLLESPLGQDLNTKHVAIIKRIRSTASRTIELIRNYQRLAQLKAGKIRPAEKSIDLNQAVRAVVEYSTWQFSESLQVQLELTQESVPVFVNMVQIEQIISNLLSNAIKHCPENGLITIKTLTTSTSSRLEILNSGSFIPEHEIAIIFDRYRQAESNGVALGSGLGLFIVKSIAEAVGATIQVASQKESGTCFAINFPKTA